FPAGSICRIETAENAVTRIVVELLARTQPKSVACFLLPLTGTDDRHDDRECRAKWRLVHRSILATAPAVLQEKSHGTKPETPRSSGARAPTGVFPQALLRRTGDLSQPPQRV